MDLSKLSEPLKISDIEFRIQSINNGKYATILAYKDARCDMNRLDEAVGCLNWKREHTRDNKNCIVSIYNESTKEWITKEDTGTESNTEQLKGLASDSFKRACFNWGIGRELYDYPRIQIRLKDDEVQETGRTKPKYKASYNLQINKWRWESQFKNGKLIYLEVFDLTNTSRFKFGNYVNWLSKEQFEKAIKSDIKGIEATLNHFNTATHKMSKEYRELLNNKILILKK